MKVLIADDNDASCKLLRALLEADGHAVIVAVDGRKALELLELHPVDAIISDLLMPNLDGFRLCREIRRDRRWHRTPFICYTAIYCSLDDEKLAFDLGADAYLRKPSSRASILSTLQLAVERAQAGPPRRRALHAELDVLNEYSRPLVAELEDKNFELSGPIYFLSQGNWAIVAVIAIKVWRSFPFMMLSLLAALQVIDKTLYEAGRIDGAGNWKLFWHITMPHLKNISIIQVILMVIWSINDFETPFLLTQGGPSNATENMILLSYRYTFGRNDVGRGSAVALITLVFLTVLATLMMRQQRKSV